MISLWYLISCLHTILDFFFFGDKDSELLCNLKCILLCFETVFRLKINLGNLNWCRFAKFGSFSSNPRMQNFHGGI